MNNPRRVLIAEDDQANMRLVRDLLEMEGYETTWAADAEQAFARATEQAPDLIIMDWRMPKGGGKVAITNIRNTPSLSAVPILVVTASVLQEDLRRVIEAGGSDYMTKPIDVVSFIAKVKNLLGESCTST